MATAELLHSSETGTSHPQPWHRSDKVQASHCQGTFTLLMARLPSSSLLSEKHCETNTNYPCCSTLRIEAQFAARAAHLPAPAAPRSAPWHSQATCRWWHQQPGWSGHGQAAMVNAGPCLCRLSYFRDDRSQQRQILQLLQLAQAASDYLKPQPFFYERRAPDIRWIDLCLLKQQPGSQRECCPSLWITELIFSHFELSICCFHT